MIDHDRRKFLLTNATFNPSYAWIVNQLSQAFPGESYKYLICDNDKKFGKRFGEDLQALFHLNLKQTSFRSPWQNGVFERVIGTIRRDCLDHIVIFNEAHLKSVLADYNAYYNEHRKHRSLKFEAPIPKTTRKNKNFEALKKLLARKHCKVLHNSYEWLACG